MKVAQDALNAAQQRRALLKTIAAKGGLSDGGSDSSASASTASTRVGTTPTKGKPSANMQTTPAVSKRIREKTTPIAMAEKTPSTSTPLPKALKSNEPPENTPVKGKCLEFEDVGGTWCVKSSCWGLTSMDIHVFNMLCFLIFIVFPNRLCSYPQVHGEPGELGRSNPWRRAICTLLGKGLRASS